MPSILDKLRAPHHLRQQLGGVFFLALIVFARRDSTPFEREVLLTSGTFFFLVGFLGRIWASGYLIKNDALTTTGPYGYVRNPIYVSNLLLGLGLIVLSGLYWAVVILGLLYGVCYVPGMRVEEENLRRRYGASFDTYAQAVPLIAPKLRRVEGYGGGIWTFMAYLNNRELYVSAGLALGFVAVIWQRLNS